MNSKSHYHVAIVRVQGCNEAMATAVADTLEHDFELLGLTSIVG
jgi:phospholipid-translocating ATPase